MTIKNVLQRVFAVSNIATLIVCFYLYASLRSIHNLMYPLNGIDIGSYTPKQLVRPYWETTTDGGGGGGGMGMKIYLSTSREFHVDFMVDEYRQKAGGAEMGDLPRKRKKDDSVLLWEEPSVSYASLAKSFILTSNPDNLKDEEETEGDKSESFVMASKWLKDADQKAREDSQGGVAGVLSSANAGEGIASTSVLLSLYTALSDTFTNLMGTIHRKDDDDTTTTDASCPKEGNTAKPSSTILPISPSSTIWTRLMSNSTAHIHVLLQRHPSPSSSPDTFHAAHQSLTASSQSNNLLLGHVDLIKYSPPHHIPKPRRYLYTDILYLLRRYILRTAPVSESPPWDMERHSASSAEFRTYRDTMEGKAKGEGYPYWKPEVAIKLVQDDDVYPMDHVHRSGMQVIKVPKNAADPNRFESQHAYLPGLHVDEIGLTSEKYVPVNGTVDSLPLRISFDGQQDGETAGGGGGGGGVSSGSLSPPRWRLLSHLSASLQSQQELGFEQSDIDDVRRLIADTNVTLLAITVLASTLHLLFEFLTFKNEVEFWNGNKDLTGLSVRALFMDFVSQVVVLLFLFEEGTSLLMTVPAGFGCGIALWKCQRGAGFRFVRVGGVEEGEWRPVWNRFLGLFGYELQATRLRAAARKKQRQQTQKKKKDDDNDDNSTTIQTNESALEKSAEPTPKSIDLAALSEETDRLATQTLGLYLLLPLVLSYATYTLLNERHSGWYSWFITSASSAVYALGFVMMTPQLFLNYKLKSVAHLPWRVLGYRFVNTFIDDLFAFIIRMPTMARISCFRDDVVFFVYLWQRYLYPVDRSRPVEGGGMDAVSAAASSAVVVEEEEDGGRDGVEKKNKKKKKKVL